MGHTHTVSVQPFLTSAARTTNGQSSGYRVDCFFEGLFFVNVSAIGGTNPKLKVYPQVSVDDSTYFAHPDSTPVEITATGQYVFAVTNFGKYMRVVYEVTGSSDKTVTFAVTFSGKE